jgi:hypothetical protein
MPLAEPAVRRPTGDGLARRASSAIVGPSGRTRDRPLRTGLRLDPLMPIERWTTIGTRIAAHSDAASWWLGDWLAFGQAKYGRRYKEGLIVTGLEYQTLRNYAMVARRFDMSRRRDDLSFQHHAEVCSLTDDDQDRWLDLAATNHWSRNELRRRVRAAGTDPTAPGRVAVIRLVLEPRRAQHWRRAARQDDCALEAWVMHVLDEAATSALEEREP